MKWKKCLFLIPTSYNDGTEVPPEVMDSILSELYLVFDGYSIDGVTKGAWKMKDGARVENHSLKIWIVMSEEKVAVIRKLVRKYAKVLRQESIYFETMDWEGEFLQPE